jgi:HEAT repeat protein
MHSDPTRPSVPKVTKNIFSEKYKSPAVMEALMDLLDDEDFNVCAVAAISLSKIKCKNKQMKMRIIDRIINVLNSSDRLVRETGCLALGRLKATKAVTKLVKLW